MTINLEEAKRRYEDLVMSVAVAKQAAFVRHVNSLNAKLASVDVERGSLKRPAYAATRLTVWQSVKRRFPLLAMLMMLQSFSSFILASFSALIESHVIVTLYLTMLVGAGGNAGNQSSVLVIRRIATTGFPGFELLYREAMVGVTLAVVLVAVGFGRVYLLQGSLLDATAICLSLFVIVSSSVVIGALLPLLFYMAGRDPAHAGPTIQVVMDITGVWVTCTVCNMMLGDGTGGVDGAPVALDQPLS